MARADALAVHDNGRSSRRAGSASATAIGRARSDFGRSVDGVVSQYTPEIKGSLLQADAEARGGDGTQAISTVTQLPPEGLTQGTSFTYYSEETSRGVVSQVVSQGGVQGANLQGSLVDTSAEMGNTNAAGLDRIRAGYSNESNIDERDNRDVLAMGSANFASYSATADGVLNANIDAAFTDYYGLGVLGGGGLLYTADTINGSVTYNFTLDTDTELLVGLVNNPLISRGGFDFLNFDLLLNGQAYGATDSIFENDAATSSDALAAFNDSVFSFGSLAAGNYELQFLMNMDVNNGGNFYGEFVFGAGDGSNALALSQVPVPAAVWLFGSGLIGLIGVARRKKA